MVKSLKAAGITKVVMMTGDSERTAAAIAKRVGVVEYYAKFCRKIKRILQKKKSLREKSDHDRRWNQRFSALSAADAELQISDGAEIAREIADITIAADVLRKLLL